MEEVKVPFHKHPLIPFTRFVFRSCDGCTKSDPYIYGGYRCNEFGCDTVYYHKECGNPLQELNHSSHSDHPLKLIIQDWAKSQCSICHDWFKVGYSCSTCDFKLDLSCARRPFAKLPSSVHEHPLDFCLGLTSNSPNCKTCDTPVYYHQQYYKCNQCRFVLHVQCAKFYPEAYHSSHSKHPLKFITCQEAPGYADNKCLLCESKFEQRLHHCDVCNFSICKGCMNNPPPLVVTSLTTHEHQLHLVPRLIEFTCNACGTLGDRSPYFCLQCNFMIHRGCIDLPRVININRHDHRISYTSHLGYGNWTCKVCRKKVDGFYGGYTCFKCSSFVVHSRCATRKDVWDMIELEGTPEELEDISPFEVIDDNIIKHFSHDHNLTLNKDGKNLHENVLCEACVFQICSEPLYYSCEQCDFILHEKCANLPRKKRHVSHNLQFTLHANSGHKAFRCSLCNKRVTGFKYQSDRNVYLDVRCSSDLDPFLHQSHPHPLYYDSTFSTFKQCNGCKKRGMLSCDECDFSLDFKCALLPQKVMRHRYDDHPLFLSFGDQSNVDGKYWCEACEAKVNPKKWFYTCNDCGSVLHVKCVVGGFSYIMPGSEIWPEKDIVANTSICRPICSKCNSRCKLPSILKYSKDGVDVYVCSFDCETNINFRDW